MADPTTIGKYTVVRKIGQGGMGKVYAATHPTLKRTIIIKQLLGSAKKMMTRRFLREASLMLDFRQDNIVPVYDHFKEGNSYFIAMEYVEGLSLEDLIKKKGRLTPLAAMLIFREACKGLAYAHNRGVIHRDIKPDNVLIANNGAVKLADFGIATAPDGEEGLTKTGVAMGTPAFMSPEQIADAKNVDKRSDIYSMGVMLYQMATGQKPFSGSFSAESINKITKGKYIRPRKLNRETPRFLRRIIRKAMHHKRRRRYADLEQIIRKLNRRLRSYSDPIKINGAIEEYIASEKGAAARPRLKGQMAVRWGTRVGALLLVLGIGVAHGLHTGWLRELTQQRSYGAVEISVNLPSDYYKDPGHVYAVARLESVDPGEERDQPADEEQQLFLPEDESSQPTPRKQYLLKEPVQVASMPFLRWAFLRNAPGQQPQNDSSDGEEPALRMELESPEGEPLPAEPTFLTTGRRYLPAGHYRVALRVENKKYLHAIYLHPREVQRESLDTLDGQRFELEFPPGEQKKIEVVHRIADAESGESISRETVVYMRDRERWINWDEYKRRYRGYLENLLLSGREFQFRYELHGYYSKELSLTVEPDADALDLRVDLMPKPGTLRITSDAEGLNILLNNKRADYIGTESREYTPFGKTEVGSRSFDLPAGEYILLLQRGSRASASYQTVVKRDQTVEVDVSYDQEAQNIEIEER